MYVTFIIRAFQHQNNNFKYIDLEMDNGNYDTTVRDGCIAWPRRYRQRRKFYALFIVSGLVSFYLSASEFGSQLGFNVRVNFVVLSEFYFISNL